MRVVGGGCQPVLTLHTQNKCSFQVGSDNEVFIMHDSSLSRTTNCTGSAPSGGVFNVPFYGYIEGCSADFGSYSTGELVPHLRDVLDLMMEWPDRYVLLDIKTANPLDIMDFMRPIFADYDYDFSRQVYIAPWTGAMLDRAAQQLPGLPTSVIALNVPRVNTDVDSFNVNFSSVSRNEGWIREAQAEGKSVFSWTINAEAQMVEAFQLGIDGVLTDFIEQCETIRRAGQ